MASEMTHQATSFFITGVKWVISLPCSRSITRDPECAGEKGAGAWSGSIALRECVWLSENNYSVTMSCSRRRGYFSVKVLKRGADRSSQHVWFRPRLLPTKAGQRPVHQAKPVLLYLEVSGEKVW